MTEKKMTDEEAVKLVGEAVRGAWICGWESDKPHTLWTEGLYQPNEPPEKLAVLLDGRFTRDQLLAILHFHPDNQCKKSS